MIFKCVAPRAAIFNGTQIYNCGISPYSGGEATNRVRLRKSVVLLALFIMKVYLLTAAGVIFLSVIVSLLLPEGKLKKTATFIMRLICIFVLIQPVTGIFKIENTSGLSNEFFDKEYVSGVYSAHQSEQLEILLKKEFGVDTDCNLEVGYENGEFKVQKAEVCADVNNEKIIEEIYAYLDGLGYINITVYAKSP